MAKSEVRDGIVPWQNEVGVETEEVESQITVMEAIQLFLGPLSIFPELCNELYQMLESQFELEFIDYGTEVDTSELAEDELAAAPWLFFSDLDLELRTYKDWNFMILFGLLIYNERDDVGFLMGSVPDLLEEVVLPENFKSDYLRMSARINLIKKYSSHEFFRQSPH
jgi:hypothetical protein